MAKTKRMVIGGVDMHGLTHHAAVIDERGRLLACVSSISWATFRDIVLRPDRGPTAYLPSAAVGRYAVS